MLNYRVEDFLTLCALTYYDAQHFHTNMLVSEWIEEIRKTDITSVFFKNTDKYLKKQDLKKFYDLNITNYVNDNQRSGLVYYCFEDDENCYILYRGSELFDPVEIENGLQDWFDNLEIFLGITHQQLKAFQMFNDMKTKKKIHLIGHSKGGNIALFVGIVCNDELFSKISQIITFNAPQMSLDVISTYKHRIQNQTFLEKVLIIENERDFVSSMFYHVKQPIYIRSNYRNNRLIDTYESHQIWGFRMKDGLVVSKSKTMLPTVIDFLTSQFIIRLNKVQKKTIIHTWLELFKNKKTMKIIQEKIEGWINKNENIE